jgi:hypothetical protein
MALFYINESLKMYKKSVINAEARKTQFACASEAEKRRMSPKKADWTTCG